MITLCMFIIVDFIIGKKLYKKFIKKTDWNYVETNQLYTHDFKKHFKTNHAEYGSIRFEFCSDKNNFRNFCKNMENENKVYDIGIIGDSFIEGIGLNYNKTFVGQLTEKLPSLKIANLGVQSYSPSIYNIKIKNLISKGYKFKEIIVFIDISDIQDEAIYYQIKQGKVLKRDKNLYENLKKIEDLEKPIIQKITRFLDRRVIFTYRGWLKFKKYLISKNLIKYKIPDSVINVKRSEWTFKENSNGYGKIGVDGAIKISLKNMENLAEYLKENNTDLSIGVYPWPAQLKYDKVNNKQVKIWKQFCEDKCKLFFDFMPYFFNDLKENSFKKTYRKYFILDDVHFNYEGNKLLVEGFIEKYH